MTSDLLAAEAPAGPARTRRPTEYRILARSTPDGAAAVDTSTSTVAASTSWDGPGVDGAGPGELLAGAFATCLLKNLDRGRALLGFAYDSAEVEVVARRQDRPPRFVEISYTMRIRTDEPDRRVALMHKNLQRHGTVYNTLASVCDVHGTVVAVPTRG